MHLRIQTTGGSILFVVAFFGFRNFPWYDTDRVSCTVAENMTALAALEKGFSDLMDLCDVVTEKFTESRDQFNEESSNRMEA